MPKDRCVKSHYLGKTACLGVFFSNFNTVCGSGVSGKPQEPFCSKRLGGI